MTNVINFADYRKPADLTSVIMKPVPTTDTNQGEAETIPVARFKVGETYTCRSICDHNTIFEYTVIARTAKRITIRDKFGKESKRGVYMYGNTEQCKPQGTYSMCPVISAD